MINFLIGANGTIGRKLKKILPSASTIIIDKSIYRQWLNKGGAYEVSNFFEKWSGKNALIYITAGIINPHKPISLQNAINYELPKNIVDGCTILGIKVVVLGTVMDRFISKKSQNNCLKSKRAFSEFIRNYDNNDYLLYIKLHTIFGSGYPKDHMFLGQIFNAIKFNLLFGPNSIIVLIFFLFKFLKHFLKKYLLFFTHLFFLCLPM